MDAGPRAKGVVWLLIGVICCALCYSLGWQYGWSQATSTAGERMQMVNEELNSRVRDDATEAASLHSPSDSF